MSFSNFARMCEVLEQQTPTQKAETISSSLNGIGNKGVVMQILSLDYPINNIGESRAITWIANALGVFEDEVESAVSIWGDVGEAVAELDIGNETDSDISIVQALMMLELDCSRINSNAYTLFAQELQKMSAREKKWFIRYWLRKPRNGVNNKVPLKAISKHFSIKYGDITKYSHFYNAGEICKSLEDGVTPECKLTHGHFVSPMLAKPRKGKERPKEYIVDVKYDGNRYQIHFDEVKESVIIFNRKGKVATNQYPDIVKLILEDEVFKIGGIYDTEIYPIKTDGTPAEHKLLAKRVHKLNKEEAVQQCPVKLAVFDVLKWNEESCLDKSLKKRIKLLDMSVFPEYRAKRFDDTTIKASYHLAIDWGFEGIMIKDSSLAYDPGKRSKGWLKYKPPRIELDVVITSAQYGKGKRSNVFGTYGISVRDGADYIEVGKVGTGFTDEELIWLTNELRKSIERYEDNVYHFSPRLVLQVTSDLISNDSDGNIGLRFPRSMRVRHDKYPAEADTIQRVKELM